MTEAQSSFFNKSQDSTTISHLNLENSQSPSFLKLLYKNEKEDFTSSLIKSKYKKKMINKILDSSKINSKHVDQSIKKQSFVKNILSMADKCENDDNNDNSSTITTSSNRKRRYFEEEKSPEELKKFKERETISLQQFLSEKIPAC